MTEPRLIQSTYTGQTEPVESNGAADTDDFLARERAALGDDANQFATPQDQAAVAENVDTGNDLLGGAESTPGQQAAPEEVAGFESSFPAVDTNEVQNEVCMCRTLSICGTRYADGIASYSKSPLVVRLQVLDQLAFQVTESQRRSRSL